MKYLFSLIFFLAVVTTFGQVNNPEDTTVSNPDYDKVLAARTGADDYGMKSYSFVILKTGTNTTATKELIDESSGGHLDNINRLIRQGKIIVAGPLGRNENNYRGIFILDNTGSVEEAGELLKTDPAIKTGCWVTILLPGKVRQRFRNTRLFLKRSGN